MRIFHIVTAGSIVLLCGCSGFMLQSDRETTFTESLSPSTLTVTFCGNAFMDQQDAEKYAMQRACETTLTKGYTHFVIEQRNDQSQMCYLTKTPVQGYPDNNKQMPYSATTGSQKMMRPNLSLTIRCYTAVKAPKGAIDAQKYLDMNFPGLKLNKNKLMGKSVK